MTLKKPDNQYVIYLINNCMKNFSEAQYFHRLHCVLIASGGICSNKIAEWFNHSPSTVARWVQLFNQYGAEGLKESPKPGRPQVLNEEQLTTIKKDIARSPKRLNLDAQKWDGKCFQNYLENNFSILLSIRQCQRILKKLQEQS